MITNRKTDEEAAQGFRFNYINTLNKADGLTLAQIMTNIVKAEAVFSIMVGTLYNCMLDEEIHAAKALLHLRILKASDKELEVFNTFLRFNIFNTMRYDEQERIINRINQLKL